MPVSPYWNAAWIGPAEHPRGDLGVFLYRCSLRLESVPEALGMRVSADNRYKLYVNGRFVGFGPQRGDDKHWFYETWEVAPFLQAGDNVVEAVVWNFGRWAPMAQHTVRTGFLCEVVGSRDGEEPGVAEDFSKVLNTPGSWQVARLEHWDFRMMHSNLGWFYIDVGPGEIIDARAGSPSPWSEAEGGGQGRGSAKPLAWVKPHPIAQGNDRGAGGGGVPWSLIPRSIPPMRYDLRAEPPRIRRGWRGDVHAGEGPADGTALGPDAAVPAGGRLVLDYGELLCAYPRLRVEGPAGTTLVLTYAESLWHDDQNKGNRNEVAGKAVRGYEDRFVLSGGDDVFEPLWWRTYRYLMIEAVASEPGEGIPQACRPPDNVGSAVLLKRLDAIETGYPLAEESSFEADDARVKPLWDVAVRTAKRCAAEHYFDCPYYEQLQYVGDTRIQALIGYYLGRDRALTRNAVETLGWSLMENGLTQSRYPSRQPQVIPTFSLWWILMLYDQMLYDTVHPDFVSFKTLNRILGAVRRLAKSPEDRQFWPFGDWVDEWRWGVPPGGLNHVSTAVQLEWAQHAALCLKNHWVGKPPKPVERAFWRDFSDQGLGGEHGLTVSRRRGIDNSPSEHAEALYRLLLREDRGNQVDPWPADALDQAGAAKCTYYYQYYKHLAMRPDDYLNELADWTDMIERGLTTFAEKPEPVRSDCHAWSAHPILGFFQIVAGVSSMAPGWKKSLIEPKPGSLKRFDARIAHPDGELRVAFDGGRLEIDTPVRATLVWKGKSEELEPGRFVADA